MRLASLWVALAGCAPAPPGALDGAVTGRFVPADSGKARIVDVYDHYAASFTVGDVDGDGALELVVGFPDDARGGSDAGAVAVFPGDIRGVVDGSAAEGHLLGALDDLRIGSRVALCDVDHDGVLDLLTVSDLDRLYVWRGPLVGTQDATAAWSRVNGVEEVTTLGDVDGDGFADWAFWSHETAARLVTAALEPGRSEASALGTERTGFAYAAGDVDGDGRDDVRTGNGLERGDGTVIAWTSDDRAALYPVGDLDQDGDVDAIADEPDGSGLLRFVPGPLSGDEAGQGTAIDVGVAPLHLDDAGPLPDLDGDGRPEATAFASHTIRSDVYENERLYLEVVDGAAQARIEEAQDLDDRWAAGDLDGDGDPELVLGDEYVDGNPPRRSIGIY